MYVNVYASPPPLGGWNRDHEATASNVAEREWNSTRFLDILAPNLGSCASTLQHDCKRNETRVRHLFHRAIEVPRARARPLPQDGCTRCCHKRTWLVVTMKRAVVDEGRTVVGFSPLALLKQWN